jgi:transposase
VSDLEKAQEQIDELRQQLSIALQQIDWLKRQLFGRKSEKGDRDPHQGSLGLEDEERDEERPDATIDEPPPPPRRPVRQRGKRRVRAQRLPENLPVRTEVVEPTVVSRQPGSWRRIGEEVSRQLEREPGYFYLRETVRPKYVRIDSPHLPPVVAPAPAQVVPGGLYGSGLIAEILLAKYLDHNPLYRIEQHYLRQDGVHLPRQTMSDVIEAVAAAAGPVVRAMERELWRGGYVKADETPIRCLDRQRPGGSFSGWLWALTGATGSDDVVFRWAKSRGQGEFRERVPEDFEGFIQRDGYAAYEASIRGHPAKVTWVGCWAHARRKFREAAQAGDRVAAWFVGQIALLYAVERRTRDLPAVLRERERAVASGMVLRRIRRACRSKLVSARPKSLLGQAVAYALNQWGTLEVYVSHGHLAIDNNDTERAIRPTAVGKKNWLFIGAPEAGAKAATLYSLLGSCLRRQINPRDYLVWLLRRLPEATSATAAELTPGAYARSIAPAVAVAA